MKLVSLELKGFKSFPEKTVIHFNEAVTGVVGPNGCGKSNIVDAIRWVLGEQKTSVLRSEKMENIIFNGTRKRKPASLAEVSLTFLNDRNLLPTEYHTVTVSRHFFRNGESEYRLNGVTCRLKDITSLFIDTGISSNSYAIIELAMVDDLLNDKDGSRRRLFEQAAGISKYKVRKKESLAKLEATQQDVNRVDDLLFEIENNLKALESQARKAERYYQLKDSYREASIELALHLLEGHKHQLQGLQQQQQQLENELVQHDAWLDELACRLEGEKLRQLEYEQQLTAAGRRLQEFTDALRSKEHQKALLQEALRHDDEQLTRLQELTQRAGQEQHQVQQQAGQLEAGCLHCDEALQRARRDLDAAARELARVKSEYADLKQRQEAHRSQREEAERQLADLQRQLSVCRAQRQSLADEQERAHSDEQQRQEELVQVSASLQTCQQQEQQKHEEVRQLIQAGDLLQQEIEQNETELDRLHDELRAIYRHLDARQNEYNLTKSFLDNLEGFPESIRYLRQHTEWSTHAPLLGDIINCPAEYRVAIETYLDPYLNYYVVRNPEEAWAAISLLHQSAKGRASFFVLSEMEDPPAPLPVPSGTMSALELVEVDRPYQALVQHLLGNVFVLRDDEGAAPVAPRGAVLLAKSGRYIRGAHHLSGGHVGLISGKRLGRIKNLEALEAEIRQQQQEAGELQQTIRALQEDLLQLRSQSQDEALDRVREEWHSIRQEVSALRAHRETLEKASRQYVQHSELRAASLARLQEEERQLLLQLQTADGQLEHLTSRLTELTQQLAASEQQLQIATATYNDLHVQMVRESDQLAARQRELELRRQQLSQLAEQLEAYGAEIQQRTQSRTTGEQALQQLEEELSADRQTQTSLEQQLTQAEQRYYSCRSEISQLEEQHLTAQRNREHTRQLLSEVKDQLNELKLQLQSLRDRMELEFKVSLDGLLERSPDPAQSREELEQKTERLRRRLETFGEINPMAMEAYQEMKQRCEFIQAQKNDLLAARESLLATISEIETTARQRFTEAFESVKGNFQRVFKSLFSEDDECDLVLEDPDNPLESAIQIIARPKGKKPQIIDQLSGGEKTLTAIALLFALYLYKPAPFCVLDEVDAPLDDANISKFNRIVRDFSQKSQFILVTHNKQTMASVDCIYGITMPEEGVSSVVPVDFRHLN
ncbi:MAG: chromosome segregation protein SMC [Chitinophagales bacterium]|nr:chromosome segregation protein SMC [Chitinophagales bacterium]